MLREKKVKQIKGQLMFSRSKRLLCCKLILKKIDKIGNQIFLKNNQVEKELFLENLSLFQWSLKKTFLKK